MWPFARRPMERVHIDYFEYKGQHVLIMTDAFSKKIWCHYLGKDTTTNTTCAVLFGWFCTESGSPTTLVSDNGPQFTSKLFAEKMKLWNIKHVFSPPYHPASNGAAERAVQLVKDRLRKMNVSSKAIDLYTSLAFICKVHGLTPHSSTDRCPYELIKLGNLPSLFPNLISDNTQKSELTVIRHCTNKLKQRKSFSEGDNVVVYDNFRGVSYPAVVSEVLGANTYLVLSDNGTKHVSGDVMSRDKSRAAQPTVVLPPAAEAAEDSVDSISTVDDDNESDTSELSEDLTLPNSYNYDNYDNVNDNVNDNVVNRRGPRELNHLGPMQRSPRLRSGKRRE